MNAITDRVPLRYFDEEDEEEAGVEEPVPSREDLLHQEVSVWQRVTPDSGLGYLAYFAIGLILLSLLLWFRPVIPPWITSLPTALALAIPVAGFLGLAYGRQSGIHFWEEFEDIKLYTGSAVIEVGPGKIEGSAGDDPLVKSVDSISWGGLSVSYERVDDRFKSTTPLMSKIDRKEAGGQWEPALGKLDNVYLATGPSNVFDGARIVHCDGITETPTAKGFEWKTQPPEIVDVDAARELVRRDEILREQVIPHYAEKLSTSEEQVERFRQAATDDEPHIKLDDLPEILLALGAFSQPGGQQQGRATQAAIESLDEDVDEAMEGRTDE